MISNQIEIRIFEQDEFSKFVIKQTLKRSDLLRLSVEIFLQFFTD